MPSPEHEAFVEAVRAAPPAAGTLEESRANYDAMLSATPPPAEATIESIKIGDMDADWVSMPGAAQDKAVLYFHGGGYVIGSNVGYREFASRMSQACGAKVLVIDYRLAPEHPFPAAVEDATAAYQYILDSGIQASHIMIAGDSAGGGLTLATQVALRDKGVTLPSCAVSFSPWVDLEASGDSYQPGAIDDPMIDVEGLRTMGLQYAEADIRNPLAAPLYANLEGLPPQLIFVGTREMLLDDATRLADNARSAGVDTELVVEQDLVHVWPVFPGLPEGVKTLEHVSGFVSEHLAAG